ncbi:response regulator [Asticcacaulis sp. AND118]|uniref:response regulator n=1 Tax=Asticcacaulis sp. AND118 TaxID=2840468 RepID=UPI001CFF6945|nr:response regulator [Asticcacaulis sp. AND118]UDF03067.1 response regulator [Asticcacaulis sp. AND118]
MTPDLRHILCVDDDSDILEIVQMALEDIGRFRVTGLSSAETAISEAARLRPDLVLVDVMMPGMGGPGLLKAFRARPDLKALPVIFMTARIQASEVQDYLSLGADGVIPKPFDPMKLPEQIHAIWEGLHV